jgi:diketogulonate reductase-like aldo/keto reductase
MTSAAAIPNVALNDENAIPALGIGVGELSDADTERAVSAALEIGVRLIDTAAAYGNEAAVGRAIAASGIPRAEIFVTTKLATEDQGYTTGQEALKASLQRLGLDYVDLYLIHWPAGDTGRYVHSYGGMLKAKDVGDTKSVGVCNFMPDDLTNVMDLCFSVPTVNQIELHPLLNQASMRAFHAEHGIATEAWSPLARGGLLEDPVVAKLAAKHGRTPAQVILRWHLQLGNVVIPKSVTPSRIAENFDVLGFELDADDLAVIDALDNGGRIGPDPDTMNTGV